MPPGVSVDLDVAELRALDSDLRRAARGDRRRLLAALGNAGEGATRERIHAGGPGPDGETWKPRDKRSPSTKPLLVGSGHLARSIEPGRATPSTVTWGSRRVYARIHQMGGVVRPRSARVLRFEAGGEAVFRARARIPARPYLGWGDAERRAAAPVIAKWLQQTFGGAHA